MQASGSDQSFATYQHTIIKELKAEIARLTKQQNDQTIPDIYKTTSSKSTWKRQGLPFVFEITGANEEEIKADEPTYLYIQDDNNKGLGVPARNGYILNDGPGIITYRINNGSSKGWSHPATLKVGEVDIFEYTDNVQIVIVEITADTDYTRFRTKFTPGFVGDSD